jgi:hypothetical protein
VDLGLYAGKGGGCVGGDRKTANKRSVLIVLSWNLKALTLNNSVWVFFFLCENFWKPLVYS